MAKKNKPGSQSHQKENTQQWPKHDPKSAYYQGHSEYVTDERLNRISHEQVKSQTKGPGIPLPRGTSLSGYPHKFENFEPIESLKPSLSRASSSTSLFEYPVFGSGHNFEYDTKKPKDNPGNLRAILNQNGTVKTVLAHNGGYDAENKVYSPNVGKFHECDKEEAKEKNGQSSKLGRKKK